MPALLLAMMLSAADQDVATLRIPPKAPARQSIPWSRFQSLINCPRPARGAIVPYAELPEEVLLDLRRTDRRISPPGGPFNPSDFSVDDTPTTRVIAAMRLGGRLAVAYEKGGYGYGITVLTYETQANTGLMAVKGLRALNPRETRSGSVKISDACDAMERAVGT